MDGNANREKYDGEDTFLFRYLEMDKTRKRMNGVLRKKEREGMSIQTKKEKVRRKGRF